MLMLKIYTRLNLFSSMAVSYSNNYHVLTLLSGSGPPGLPALLEESSTSEEEEKLVSFCHFPWRSAITAKVGYSVSLALLTIHVCLVTFTLLINNVTIFDA